MSRASLTRAAVMLALGLLSAGDADGAGYSSFNFTMPPNKNGAPSLQSGLLVEVEGGWFNQFGYRPVRLHFESPSGPVVSVKELRVRLSVSDLSRSDADCEVEGSVVMTPGESAADLLLYVPQLQEMNLIWWEVEVNGRVDRELSVQSNTKLSLGQTGESSELQVLRPIKGVVTRGGGSASPDRAAGELYVGRRRWNQWFDVRCEYFKDWIGYTSADCVQIDFDDLRALADKDSEELVALRRWLLTGGMLFVERVDGDVGELREIERAVGVESWTLLRPPGTIPDPISGAEGWRHESLSESSNDPRGDLKELVEGAADGGFADQLLAAVGVGPTSRGWYARYDCGFGRVYAFRGTAQTPGGLEREQRRVAVERWRGSSNRVRLGLTPGVGSNDFANMLIPGVGLAPVGMFQLLITLFVLAIGPLNYWLLARNERLHLLVVTTPVAAALLTVGIFAYAFLGDGFGVKVRARSVTLIDQNRGEAVSWSRLSHYAGVGSEGRLAFPGDTQVVPILPAWESAVAASDSSLRTMVWRDGVQELGPAWMPTRTAVQHLAIRSRATEHRVAVAESASGVEVNNQLGADIEVIYVLDSNAEWRRGAEIDAGATARLDPIEQQALLSELRVLMLDNDPVMPLGAGAEVGDTLRFMGVNRRARRMRDIGSEQFDENTMNQFLDVLVGLVGNGPLELPPQSYVAVTRNTVETPLGIEGAREVGSFHTVVGRW